MFSFLFKYNCTNCSKRLFLNKDICDKCLELKNPTICVVKGVRLRRNTIVDDLDKLNINRELERKEKIHGPYKFLKQRNDT